MAEYKSLKIPSSDQQDTKTSSQPEIRTPPPVTHDDKVRVKILDFQITKTGSMEYVLEDETTVKFTPQLNQVLVQIDEKGEIIQGPNGMPIFSFSFGVQAQVFPKNRTLYVAKQQSTMGTALSSITL